MAKKSRLHEFEKNNRVINISQAQDERRERLQSAKQKKEGARKKKVKLNYFRLATFVLLIIIGVSFVVSAIKIVKLQGEYKDVSQKNEQLQHKKESLEMEYENVKLPEYIENQARRDLKLVKPQELLFAFDESEKGTKKTADKTKDKTEDSKTDGETKN